MPENCCKNCGFKEGYDGFNEFFCTKFNCVIRGEQYDCEGFGNPSNLDMIENLD